MRMFSQRNYDFDVLRLSPWQRCAIFLFIIAEPTRRPRISRRSLRNSLINANLIQYLENSRPDRVHVLRELLRTREHNFVALKLDRELSNQFTFAAHRLTAKHNRMESTKQNLLAKVSPDATTGSNKVTVVGVGQVGMSCIVSMLTQNVTNHVCFVDVDEKKLKGELMDLQHGSLFLNNAKIEASTDYSITANSKLCIITAGAKQRPGETRLDLVQRNVAILKSVISQLMKYSPDTILLLVANPVDVLTYVAWKLSGLPIHKVIGSGTNLDTSRFRFLVSQKLGVAPTNCHGYIIGEHGDSSVPVWSGVSIGGVRLADLNPSIGSEGDGEGWTEVHRDVIQSAYEVIKLKGYTNWAVGLSVSSIAEAIFSNVGSIHCVSTLVKGLYGIEKDVFLSLPCTLGSSGVSHIIKQHLNDEERLMLRKSAEILHDVQSKLDL